MCVISEWEEGLKWSMQPKACRGADLFASRQGRHFDASDPLFRPASCQGLNIHPMAHPNPNVPAASRASCMWWPSIRRHAGDVDAIVVLVWKL